MKLSIVGTATFIAFGVAALCTTPAHAQETVMRVTIPFAFTAGDETLPAGLYRVTVDQPFHSVRFDGIAENVICLIRMSTATDSRPATALGRGTLRFVRYGEQYFLSNVWRAGQEDGNRIPMPKRLLEAATRQTNNTHHTPEPVTVNSPN